MPSGKRLEVHGAAELRYVLKQGQTGIEHLYVRDPMKFLFPRSEAGEPPTAVVVTTAGGIVGGDRLDLDIAVGDGAEALVTAQAAEKVYGSLGPDCSIEVALTAGQNAWLEWLPQETILFENARLRRRTRLDLADVSQAMAGEILVFGRVARGEVMTRGLVRDAWEIRRDGRLVWADALHLDGDLTKPLCHPAGFAGERACATAVYAAPGAETRLDEARDILADPDGVCAGVTAFPGLLVARFLAPDPYALRRVYAGYWAGIRHHLGARPKRMPRLWYV